MIALVTIFAIVIGLIWLAARILGFLQPLLVPIAVAGIIAYLLDPLVKRLERRGLSSFRSVLVVYTGLMLFLIVLSLSVLPAAMSQAAEVYRDRAQIVERVQEAAEGFPGQLVKLKETSTTMRGVIEAIEKGLRDPQNWDWLQERFPLLVQKVWEFAGQSFGVIGYVLGFFLIPIYLFFFLKESQKIQDNWTRYVPLKASRFKDEVVGALTEINGYLIAFFRGQLVVSMIDGALIAVCLLIIGMPYAILIGVFVALLGLIPYIGNLLCLIPAIAISLWHYSSPENHIFGIEAIWVYPLIVIAIFTVTQQLNSLVTAPRIVGDAVGLHPLTVIFSVLFWSLLIGGLLGSLLAVPLTASVKVLFRRYVWEIQFPHENRHAAEVAAEALEHEAVAEPEDRLDKNRSDKPGQAPSESA